MATQANNQASSALNQGEALRPEIWNRDSQLHRDPKQDLLQQVQISIRHGQEFLYSSQREELFWCAELESNATITAEYIFMRQILGLDLSFKRNEMIHYFTKQQKPDGSWGIASNAVGDVSTTAETYLALRILGLDESHPVLEKAQSYILSHGGLEEIRIFTRIFFAMFGLIPWTAIPAVPPEFILLPPQSPANIYGLSSWARGTMIPLFVICHHRPLFALPNGKHSNNSYLDHLWLKANEKNIPYSPAWHNLLLKKGLGFETLFGTADSALRFYEPFRIKSLRERAIKKCLNYILEHQEESGDWGGIFPPMMNGILALTLEGYSLTSAPIAKGLKAIENFSWEDEQGFRIQACVSPVWDTAWAAIALIDSHAQPSDSRIKSSADWILKNQIRVEYGDWKVYRPHLISGGWAFEYHNTWYPDVDDTAAVLLALLKQDPTSVLRNSTCRAVEWVLGMQNRDGGWAAFDVNNDKLFLNKIPFSDMDSLCDTSCADITARVIEAFSFFLKQTKKIGEHPNDDMERRMRAACEKGLRYLRSTQEADGSWLGRWGVNYIYGTSHALCGLAEAGVSAEDRMVRRAIHFLEKVQNEDCGWGEAVESYNKLQFVAQSSTASQTAWGLLGLLAYSSPHDLSIQKGIKWLVDQQVPASEEPAFEGGLPVPKASGRTWNETESTGTGFPGHFYLRYHLYRHVFPLMALGRYMKALEN